MNLASETLGHHPTGIHPLTIKALPISAVSFWAARPVAVAEGGSPALEPGGCAKTGAAAISMTARRAAITLMT